MRQQKPLITAKKTIRFTGYGKALMVFMMTFSCSSLLHADSVRFYGVGDIPAFNKKIVSLRENKFKNLVEQRFDFSCGAAAVTTILKYAYHIDVTELDVIKGMAEVADPEVVKEKGFSLLDIRKYVETHGLRGRGYQVDSEALAQVKIPTIVLLDLNGYKHFVVLRRVAGDTVFVGDPALGNRAMPFDEFVSNWNGTIFAVVGKGYDRDTVLSYPEPPLTARRHLFDNYSPATTAELLDFGFKHTELF